MKIQSWKNLRDSNFDFKNYDKFTDVGTLELTIVRLAYSKTIQGYIWAYGYDENRSKFAVYIRKLESLALIRAASNITKLSFIFSKRGLSDVQI